VTAPYPYRSATELSPFSPAETPPAPERVARREQLADDDRRWLWKPFTQMQAYQLSDPVIIEEGLGCWLRDVHDRAYLDGNSSLWVNLHGHRRPEIDRAIRSQLERIAHCTMLGPSNVPAIELARTLAALAPSPKLTRVFYSDSGSTAVEIAVKMAFQYWQQVKSDEERTVFVRLDNAYHGDTIGSVSVGGIDLFHGVYGPLLFQTERAHSPYCYRCPVGRSYPGCDLECTESIREAFERNPGKVAALIVEPLMQGAAGILIYPPEVLSRAAEIAREHGALLIADEVATGFGRTGELFACQHAGVEPDLVAVAKGLSAGYLPLAATLATEEIYRGFLGEHTDYKTFFHGHSYTGNPLACAAAIANLALFADGSLMTDVRRKAGRFGERLKAMGTLPNVGDVRQLGLIAGVELVRERDGKVPFRPDQQAGNTVCNAVRERGVMVRPLGDVLVLMPPLAVSDDEIDLLCGVVHEAIEAIGPQLSRETIA
jgi:adenosylmethionine---8-amino-7-oxononanoate aminotransferase